MSRTALAQTNNIGYISGLDGLRAISVTLVVFFHYTSYFPDVFKSPHVLFLALGKALSIGWVGVDIFFVISGYLITKLLIRSPTNSLDSYYGFICKRGKRLLPAYLACVIFVLLVAIFIFPDEKIVKNQYLLWTMSSNLSTLSSDRSAMGGVNFSMFHFWSLALEWQFYLTFPAAITILKSARSAAFIAIFVAITTRLFLIALTPINYDNAIYSLTFCRGDALAMGVLLATIPPSKNIWHTKIVGALGAISFVALLSAIAISATPFKSILWLQTIGYTSISASIAMIIYFILNTRDDSITIRILETRPITAIGRASYSIYIWHLPFYPMICSLSRSYSDSALGQLIFSSTLAVLTTAIFSAASYRYLESRFMYHRPRKI